MKENEKITRRGIALFLAVVTVLCCLPMAALASETETDAGFSLPIPTLTNTSVVRYWGFNSSASTRTGLSAASPAKYLSNLSSDLSGGGRVVISDKGWISTSKTFSYPSTVLITGKAPDGTYYYDPVSPDLSDQKGMFMINASATCTVAGSLIFENTVILERNPSTKLSTLSVADGGVLYIRDSVRFGNSVGAENTKLKVEAGGIAILESAGFSSYSGEGTIYIDDSIDSLSAEQFASFKGDIYSLEGKWLCTLAGRHDIYYDNVNGQYYELCAACDHSRVCQYSVPSLENRDTAYYWAYHGNNNNDGLSADMPKANLTNICSCMDNGGTVYTVGKGYLGASFTPAFGGCVRITAVLPDGTDCRESSTEYGAVMMPGGDYLNFSSDAILEQVNLYSRSPVASTIKVTGGATLLLSDVECKVSNSAYPTNALYIESGSVVIMQGDDVGSFSSITGDGILVADERLVENGKLTAASVADFDGIIITPDYGEITFPEPSPREGIMPNDVFLSGSFTDSKGTTIPYRYYIPEGYDSTRSYPVLLHMHGNGSRGSDNESQLTVFSAVLNTKIFQSKYDVIIIAPQCPSSSEWVPMDSSPGSDAFIGRSEMSPYLNAAKELFDDFVSDYSVDRDRFYAIGTSNGGMAVWELMYRSPDLFAAAIPMAGAKDDEAADKYAQKFGNTAVWTFHGTADATCDVSGTRALVRELTALGKNVTYTEVKGSTHNNIWADAANTVGIVDWLFSQTKNTTSAVAGDIDLDSKLTNEDITLAVRHLAGWQTGYDMRNADMNGDGRITNRDAIELIVNSAEATDGIPSVSLNIGSIALYNEAGTPDSHADDTDSSMLESNFREQYYLDKTQLGIDTVFYPRVKKLANGNYFLTYQNKKTSNSIYYAISSDMKSWTPRGRLFSNAGSKWYATADSCVLANGDILVVTSFNTSYNGDPMGNGIAMKRSKDNGATWSAEKIIYRGTTWEPSILQLKSGEIQVYWTNTHVKGVDASLGGRVDDTSTGTMMIRSYDNGATWTGDLSRPYAGQIVAQQLTKTGSDGNYYSGQMPVAVQLNNGNIALALEVRVPKPTDPASSTYHLAFAYTDGDDPWPDALGVDEEGPVSLVPNAMLYKAGPYLRQFISGETVLGFHWGVAWYYALGNSTATSFQTEKVFFDGKWIHQWGAFEITDTHALTGVVPAYGNSGLYLGNMYLNHTLTAAATSANTDGLANDWEEVNRAFFVGSDSQAQSSIRVMADDKYLYVYAETLDSTLTDSDRLTLHLNTASLGTSYISVSAYASGKVCVTDSDGNALGLEGFLSRVYTDGKLNSYSGSDNGYVAELRIPRSALPGGIVRICPALYNNDEQFGTPIVDTIGSTDISDATTWLKIKVSE